MTDREIIKKVEERVPNKYVPVDLNIWTNFRFREEVLVRYTRWLEAEEWKKAIKEGS